MRVFPFQRRTETPAPHGDLAVCRSCGSEYVIPVDWTAEEEDAWWIRLRCGECALVREVVVSDAAAQDYDRRLDQGVQVIARALRRHELEQMAREAETFATALELDLVNASDFVR
jgi:hypothetical protein